MIIKTKILHTFFSFEKNIYTDKPSLFSIFCLSHNKFVGSVLVEIENNKFVLSEMEFKNEKVKKMLFKELDNYNKKWKTKYEY